MSNLCYNCGNCHFPRPCESELKFCNICRNYGHAFNFCPLSVKQKDPNYHYWALCHNCDVWHLPNACTVPLHKCSQCGCGGHKEYFCPVNPIGRHATQGVNAPPSDPKGENGAKRQRTDEGYVESNPDTSPSLRPRPELAYQIRVDAARDTFYYLERGYSKDHIFNFMISGSQPMVPTGHAFSFPPPPVASAAPSQNIIPTYQTLGNAAQSFYTTQHDRFANGELAQTTATSHLPSSPPATRKKPAKKPTKKAQKAASTIPASVAPQQTPSLPNVSMDNSGFVGAATQTWAFPPTPMSAQAFTPHSAGNGQTPRVLAPAFDPARDAAQAAFAELINSDQSTAPAQGTPGGTTADVHDSGIMMEGVVEKGKESHIGPQDQMVVESVQGAGASQMEPAQSETTKSALPVDNAALVGNSAGEPVQEPVVEAKAKKTRARATKRKN